MAIGYDTTAANVKPLEGALIRRYTAGATIAAGQAVYRTSTAKTVALAKADAITTCWPFAGIALQSVVSGDRVDVVTGGAVNSVTGATAGALVYLSDTAGQVSETAGTKSFQIGYVEDETVIFISPAHVAVATT